MLYMFLVELRGDIPHGMADDIRRDLRVTELYELNNHALLLRSLLSNPKDIAELVGVGEGESNHSGIVFGLNGNYWGFHESELWDWLKKDRVSV